jgi:hypothetical protein
MKTAPTDSGAMSLDQLADHGLRLAESFLLARGDLPSLVVGYRGGEVRAAVPLVWSDAGERARQLAQIRRIFVTIGIEAYFVAQEVAMVEMPADRVDPWDPDSATSREGLRVIAADRDGAAVIRLGWIERDPAGHPTRVEIGPALKPPGVAGDLGDLASLRSCVH